MKFEVGQRVRVIDNEYNSKYYQVGDEGVIFKHCGTLGYWSKFDNPFYGDGRWSVAEICLEVIQ